MAMVFMSQVRNLGLKGKVSSDLMNEWMKSDEEEAAPYETR